MTLGIVYLVGKKPSCAYKVYAQALFYVKINNTNNNSHRAYHNKINFEATIQPKFITLLKQSYKIVIWEGETHPKVYLMLNIFKTIDVIPPDIDISLASNLRSTAIFSAV